MSIRSSLVTIRDAEGIEHTVEVTAESLYEAVALVLSPKNRKGAKELP
jgi:hypothetical protein